MEFLKMKETIYIFGTEYHLDKWFYNDDYTKKIAHYISSDGESKVLEYDV